MHWPLARGSSYEVLGLIGAGGMVRSIRPATRASIVPSRSRFSTDLAADVERRARFEREARTIST